MYEPLTDTKNPRTTNAQKNHGQKHGTASAFKQSARLQPARRLCIPPPLHPAASASQRIAHCITTSPPRTAHLVNLRAGPNMPEGSAACRDVSRTDAALVASQIPSESFDSRFQLQGRS
jgi:hypothetical protein